MSNELPLNTGACQWVASASGRELTDIERELVTILCGALNTGPWNVHRNWSIMKTDRGGSARMSVPLSDLCTFDAAGLSRLVFAAHDRCCRVALKTSGPGLVCVMVSKRERIADTYHRHPTLEDAVEGWRLYTLARPKQETS